MKINLDNLKKSSIMKMEFERKTEKREPMLEIKAQEVKGIGPGHPCNFRMPAVLSFVSLTDRSLIFSLYLPYLTSIFDMLRRGTGVPAGISIASFSSVFRFANRQAAMSVTRLQAAAQP